MFLTFRFLHVWLLLNLSCAARCLCSDKLSGSIFAWRAISFTLYSDSYFQLLVTSLVIPLRIPLQYHYLGGLLTASSLLLLSRLPAHLTTFLSRIHYLLCLDISFCTSFINTIIHIPTICFLYLASELTRACENSGAWARRKRSQEKGVERRGPTLFICLYKPFSFLCLCFCSCFFLSLFSSKNVNFCISSVRSFYIHVVTRLRGFFKLL